MDGWPNGAGLRRPPQQAPRTEEHMNQPAQPLKMREQMPKTAEWIDKRRAEYGAAYVNDCIRRSMAGEEGLFYAIEAGHVLGTPFPATSSMAEWQRWAIVAGMRFAAFLQRPADDRQGSDAAVPAGDSVKQGGGARDGAH